MEENKLADLLRIGLTDGEAKIYVALLELGSSSVGPIRKRTKISHSNIYEILERLINKGVVTTIISNNIKIFQAVSPGNLSRFLDKKEEELHEQRSILAKALPRIEALQNLHPKQEATLFIGIKGLHSAYEELFKDTSKGVENLWMYTHDKKYEPVIDKFYTHSWLELANGIHSRGISDESYRPSKFAKEFQKKFKMRFVDFPIFSHGEVFGEKFMLVSWEDPIIAVLVHAKHVSEHFRKYFESVWSMGKK